MDYFSTLEELNIFVKIFINGSRAIFEFSTDNQL